MDQTKRSACLCAQLPNDHGQSNGHISGDGATAAANGTLPVQRTTNNNRLKDSDYARYLQANPGAKLIGIKGGWYDITNFISVHPGGDVIEHFVGKDASPLFRSFHEKDVLRHRKPVGRYEPNRDDPAGEAFAELHQYFIDNGYFQTSLRWYAAKFAVAFAFLAAAVSLVVRCEGWAWHCVGAVCLAAFWQQAGFFLHDFMHNQLLHDRRLDQWAGTFFGTVCLGLSASWWRDEHFVHHALTNTVDVRRGFFDPQMRETSWVQNEKLFPFYAHKVQEWAIRVQHYAFIPLCTVVGRINILILSFQSERRPRELVAGCLHWTWVCALLSFLPGWREVFVFYMIASSCQGILHIQLLMSHYAKPFFEHEDLCVDKHWYRMQIECNINIANPAWFDWFHGGLNFHIEHHLYPTMPRHNYRRASVHIRRACRRLGIEYDECGWFRALARTLQCLKKMSVLFKLDPR